MLRAVRPSVGLFRFLILSRSLYGAMRASPFQMYLIEGSTSKCYQRGANRFAA